MGITVQTASKLRSVVISGAALVRYWRHPESLRRLTATGRELLRVARSELTVDHVADTRHPSAFEHPFGCKGWCVAERNELEERVQRLEEVQSTMVGAMLALRGATSGLANELAIDPE